MLNPKNFTRQLLFIFLTAAVCRLAPLLILGPQAEPDTASYMQVAATLAETGNFSKPDLVSGEQTPYAYRMPLFHVMIAGLIKIFGPEAAWPLAAANLLLSVMTVLCAVLLFYILSGPETALAAGYLAALNPNAVFNSLLLLNDSLFAFFSALMVLAGLWALKRRTGAVFFLWGVSIGLCSMVRPIMKFYWAAPLLLVFTPFFRAALKEKARLALLCASGVAALLVPWSLRNRQQLGFFGLELNQGVNTLWSTSDLVKPSTPEEYRADPRLAQMRDITAASPSPLDAEDNIRKAMGLSMPEVSAGMTRLGTETILRNPLKFFVRVLRNLINITTSPNSVMELAGRLGGKGPGYFPDIRTALRGGYWTAIAVNLGPRLVLFVICWILAPLGVLVVWRGAGPEGKIRVLLPVSLIFYTLFLTPLVAGYDRYRLPLDPVLLGFAAAWLLSKLKRDQARP